MITQFINVKPSPDKSLPMKWSFFDQGVAITPATITWSLSDGKGTTINSRTDVSVASGSTVYIALAAADLDPDDGYERVFTLEWTYNSATYGAGIDDGLQVKFTIEKWV